MRSVSYRLADLIKARIPLGFVGENEHTVVQFDAKQAFDQYPTATPSLTVKNPSGEKYPAVVTRDGDMVIWTISDSDLIVPGRGEFQLQFKEGDTVMRSYVGETRIERSIMPTGDVPTPVQNWIDAAEDVLEEVEEAIPAGGTTGQVLAKKTNADRDTEWVDQAGGGGGTSNYNDLSNKPQIGGVTLSGDKTLHELGAAAEADIPDVSGFYTKPSGGIPASDIADGVIPTVHNVPAGGSANQVLAKNSGTDYDLKWVNQSGGGGGAEIDDTAGEGDTTVVWSADKTWTETSELKEAIATFEKGEGGVYENVSYTATSGKYITKGGNITSANGWSYTDPIAVNAGDIVENYAKGYSTNVAMIAVTDSTGSAYTAKAISTDSTLKSYFYTCEADGYIACSFKNSDGCKITIRSKASNKALDARTTAVEQNALIIEALKADGYLNVVSEGVAATMSGTGHYITHSGAVDSSGSFNMSAAISLPANSTIKFLAKGYTNNVAVLARLNGDGTYTPLIVPADSNEKYFVYTTYDAVNVVISTNKSTSPVYSVYASKIDALDGKMNVIEDDLFAFATMGVIGDSLASGASNYSGGTADRPVYSWGKYIERVYGVETSLFTLGGFTTKNWLSTAQGLPALQAADPLDCYVIGLGQNDQYSYGAQYIGTVADVHVGNESENPDTYFGNYSKIIATIKTKSPRAKIFCLTNAREDSTLKADFNNAIKALVPLYTNTYLVDLAADPFYTSREFNDAWYGAHSTAIGYKMIGKNIHDNIVKVMRQKITEFKDIQWIIDDHP